MYRIGGRRSHKYRNLLMGLAAVSIGLLVYDIYMTNAILVIKWTLYALLGIK